MCRPVFVVATVALLAFPPAVHSAWTALGPGTDDAVLCLSAFQDELAVGGSFTAAGDSTLTRVGCWTGTVWHPLGTGLNSAPLSFLETADRLYVGGAFTWAGDTYAPHVACWNATTSTWNALGAGFENSVAAFCEYHGSLIAGGLFACSGTDSVGYIARWNGTAWAPLGTGMNAIVAVLAQGSLAAGEHVVVWDGRDASGSQTPAGVYFLRLEGDGESVGRRVLRLT